jgi:hypothetical protein
MLTQSFGREVGRSDLLGDTSGLSCLHTSSPKFVENQSLARVYVPEDADNWASKFVLGLGLLFLSFDLCFLSLVFFGLNLSQSLLLSLLRLE